VAADERQLIAEGLLHGRIDEQGQVLLPVIVIAADGLELEVEAAVSLSFLGAMAVSEDLVRRLGWRRLGTRRVIYGFETVLMDHFLGTVSLGGEPYQAVVLSGVRRTMIGQKLLTGRHLHLNFSTSTVVLE
jgi:hypothetical protein